MFAFGGGFDLTPNIRAEIQFASHSGEADIDFDDIGYNDMTFDLKYKRTSLGLIMTL